MLVNFFSFSLVVVSVLGRHVGELLCRECGQVITRQSELANATGVKEDFVKYSYNFPLVGKNIKVNVLKNPAGEHFHVFAAKTAHLRFSGKAQADASWFPGMHWTVCVCKSCGRHMGWYFQPEEPTSQLLSQASFVGLVLDNVISADYVDTLPITPLE